MAGKEGKKPEKLEISEFIANQDINLHYNTGLEGLQPCSNEDKDAKNVKLNKGDKIPCVFIPKFLERNRNFFANLIEKNGLPFLTEEQQKKYGISFGKKPSVRKEYAIYSMEKLLQKWKKLGSDKFKEWAEKQFGADNIDRRKGPRHICTDIRRLVG